MQVIGSVAWSPKWGLSTSVYRFGISFQALLSPVAGLVKFGLGWKVSPEKANLVK